MPLCQHNPHRPIPSAMGNRVRTMHALLPHMSVTRNRVGNLHQRQRTISASERLKSTNCPLTGSQQVNESTSQQATTAHQPFPCIPCVQCSSPKSESTSLRVNRKPTLCASHSRLTKTKENRKNKRKQ